MYKKRYIFNIVVILMLVLTTMGNVSIVANAGNENDELRADPRLLQMAKENPDDTFMVIIQKDAKNKVLKDLGLEDVENSESAEPEDTEVENEVLKGGGQIKKHLDLIVSFSAEITGREITKLAKHPKVHWISADAPVVSTAAPGMDNALDDFASQSYSGNKGKASWSSNWVESGEITSPSSGYMRVVNNSACSGGSGNCLRFDPFIPGRYIYRKLDLSGTVSATLSFYRNNKLTNDYGVVALEVSSNAGLTWTTLRTYSRANYVGSGTDTFNIGNYASANTLIRFRVTNSQIGIYYLYFDDIQIQFARPSAFLATSKANQLSLTGSGITVAVIDSGITANHPDFITGGISRIIASEKFGSNLTIEDQYGHGTHVAGTIGGNGSASNGKYRGMAPGVNLVNLKVSNELGMTCESDIVSAMQWVYDNKNAYNIRVVNLSLNSTIDQSYQISPLAAAAEILWFNGVVVVVSAGNNGTADGPATIYPPANDPFVITVGATEDKSTASLTDDTIAVFSAYGTTLDGFTKPELVAPGRNIVSPLGGLLDEALQLHPLHTVDNNYFRMSGTSMSAPVVSGAVALLLQEEPTLTPDQVKYRLMATANKNWPGYNSSMAGAGCLDIYAAVYSTTVESANTGIAISQMLTTGSNPITWGSVGWNSVGWNSVGWNSVGWNSVGWNSVGWNSVGWNTSAWDE